MVISDFVAVEFAAVLGMKMRMHHMTLSEAQTAFGNFDAWRSGTFCVELDRVAVGDAEAVLRHLDLPLRAPDALHIALARRHKTKLATFDEKMAVCARALNVQVIDI